MPRIPTWEATVSPAPALNMPEKSVGWAGIEYKELEGIGYDMTKRADELRRQRTAIESIDTLGKFSDEWDSYLRTELQFSGETSFGNIERAGEHYEQLKDKYSTTVRPEVYRNIYGQMTNMRNGGINQLANHQIGERNKVVISQVNGIQARLQQSIINGADVNTIATTLYGDPDNKVPGYLDGVDALMPGMDNTALKKKIEQNAWKNFLDREAIANPEDLPRLSLLLKDKIPLEDMQKLLSHGEMAEALKDINLDPDSFNSSRYKNLLPDQRERLAQQAERISDLRLRKRVADQEHNERTIEKAEKNEREKNDYDVTLRWNKVDPQTGQRAISNDEVENLVKQRKISLSLYDKIISGKQEYDNPGIVGDLAESVAMGRDITDQLKVAYEGGQLKGNTYITMKRNIGDDAYKSALNRVSGALKPGEFDKFSEDKNLKWSEGFDYFTKLIQSGMGPSQAADTVIDGYYRTTRRDLSILPTPLYCKGEKSDDAALYQAYQETVSAYQTGAMTATVYRHEIELIDTLRKRIQETNRIKGIQEQSGSYKVVKPKK